MTGCLPVWVVFLRSLTLRPPWVWEHICTLDNIFCGHPAPGPAVWMSWNWHLAEQHRWNCYIILLFREISFVIAFCYVSHSSVWVLLSVFLSFWLSEFLSLRLSVFLSFSLSLFLSFSLSVFISVHISLLEVVLVPTDPCFVHSEVLADGLEWMDGYHRSAVIITINIWCIHAPQSSTEHSADPCGLGGYHVSPKWRTQFDLAQAAVECVQSALRVCSKCVQSVFRACFISSPTPSSVPVFG